MHYFKPIPVTQSKAGKVEDLLSNMLLMQSDNLAGACHGVASASQATLVTKIHPKNMENHPLLLNSDRIFFTVLWNFSTEAL